MARRVPHDKHDESGRFAAEYGPEDFVDAVAGLELASTKDVAEVVGCAHRTALHHLNTLEESGEVTSRMVGRAKVWQINEQSTK